MHHAHLNSSGMLPPASRVILPLPGTSYEVPPVGPPVPARWGGKEKEEDKGEDRKGAEIVVRVCKYVYITENIRTHKG
jgi:hypothetical protein